MTEKSRSDMSMVSSQETNFSFSYFINWANTPWWHDTQENPPTMWKVTLMTQHPGTLMKSTRVPKSPRLNDD